MRFIELHLVQSYFVYLVIKMIIADNVNLEFYNDELCQSSVYSWIFYGVAFV
jgi:hypothetical protein